MAKEGPLRIAIFDLGKKPSIISLKNFFLFKSISLEQIIKLYELKLFFLKCF